MITRAYIWRAGLLAALWWVLAEGRIESWGIGLFSIMLALAASVILLPPGRIPLSLKGLAGFWVFFVRQSLQGGVQVAVMAMRPRLDLQPCMLELTLRLPVGIGRVFLVGTLNLLPGTLSVGLTSDCLRLHVLDERRSAEAGVRDLELKIARMLGLKLVSS